MTEKYCPIPISTCEYGTNKKADCENCDLNKRYSTRTIDNWETFIIDRKTGKEYGYDVDKIIDLLNNLHEGNQSLKSALKELKEIGDYQSDRIKELDKENMEYYRLFNCRNCKYHSWDYNGEDEFEVCEKGNNERLMYNKFCNEWRRD